MSRNRRSAFGTWTPITGLVCATLLLGSHPSAAKEDGAKMLDEAFVKAINANDVDGLVALYAPDAVVYTPGTLQYKGLDAIRKGFGEMLAQSTISDFKILESNYQTSGDLSCSWGLFSATMTPKSGGAAQILQARFTAVARRIEGKWLYVADHASMPVPPPPPRNTE